ncbi:hypothetical protein TanjilG_29445 [Lupinus angustifolius]|uniref:DELLA protein n=1 Tax=Lupinus angustifolius TaxID=3871 RepID=A0A4P1R589_LUPAN|nr:PREDICTED: DELLA protein GAI-like [Lupinus angustifolius]OIW02669.1 hypothetical protein TanjilG_29445 [Lupinus angustifolius]
MEKGKMWEFGEGGNNVCGNGMDELLEVLGYKVRSSDMADVAHKLEKLEDVIVTTQQNGISNLATHHTVHYNPTDLHGWVHNMLNQIDNSDNNNNNDVVPSVGVYNDDSDLRIITGVASFPPPNGEGGNAHTPNTEPPLPLSLPLTDSLIRNSSIRSELCIGDKPEAMRPVVLVQESTGVRLVQALMACAEEIQQGNMTIADTLVNQIGLLAASQGGAMRKVAYYFAQALAWRIYGFYPLQTLDCSSYSDVLQCHFYESCPYLKFAHFTANQAILDAFSAATTVHVIDFGINQGLQWPALMQALALRPGGPPAFRLTGIGVTQPENADSIHQVGLKLAQLAQNVGVPFEFRGFVCNSLADLNPFVLEIRSGESVAVNSVFELHRLLARPGSVEKVFNIIKEINPEIMTVVEQEANHNGSVFLDRFTEALHYYSSLFDSLEGSFPGSSDSALMSEMYLGRQICNVVAREGEERVERHETLSQWRVRMSSAGFEPVRLGSNAFRQARMLLALFSGGDGYRVVENNGCLMLGWHTRPLIATSAWRVAAATDSVV